jgi:hypothetical protein
MALMIKRIINAGFCCMDCIARDLRSGEAYE